MDELPKISLVITTFNRFDTYLKVNLQKYLSNRYIHEIIIMDDASDDYNKVMASFDDTKIKCFTQPHNIGALRNKIIACTKATNPWICLMDSDNFADVSYFEALTSYWKTNGPCNTCIYAPCWAKPNFDYTSYINVIINSSNFASSNGCLINTGNYVFHSSILTHVLPIIGSDVNPFAVDVKYMNYVWMKNNVSMLVVPGMDYDHVVHEGSFYSANSVQSVQFDGSFKWDF
jgi:glycosyltransferase involved in cell wall biosynthesis